MKQLILILFCACAIAPAQDDPLADHFIPPEQIMRHQGELGITESQREQIKQQVSRAQVRFTELQWDLQADVEVLSKLLENRNVSEAAVIEQLNNVLTVEADIKRTQVSMLIALRKVLTEEQLEQAQALTPRGWPSAKRMREIQRETQRVEKQMRTMEHQMRKQFATPSPAPPAPPAPPRN